MKTLKIQHLPQLLTKRKTEAVLVLAIVALSWFILPNLLQHFQPTAGIIDAGIWQLLLLALLCYLVILAISWWILNRCWQLLALIELTEMVSQFKTLSSWQQLRFYWASFALLLLAAVACLAAIV